MQPVGLVVVKPQNSEQVVGGLNGVVVVRGAQSKPEVESNKYKL